MREDFGVIIISHGRPECETVQTLKKCGYTGKMYIVVDDEDETIDKYIEKYGVDNVHVFHKYEWFDVGENENGPRAIAVFARNECLKVAQEKKLKYYLELDDDLKSLSYRYEDKGSLKSRPIHKLDYLFECICEYFDETQISGIGFGNAVDYIGGLPTFKNNVNRTIMNSFFLRTEDNFLWLGRNSEDIITVINEQKKGKFFVKLKSVQNVFDVWMPKNNLKQKGGSLGVYYDMGWYRLRFYGVLFHPDCITVCVRDNNIDSRVSTNNCYPKLISGRFKK